MSFETRRPGHIYLTCPSESNEEISRRVADGFCRAYEREFGVPADVRCIESEGVDAVVEIEGHLIAMEFVGYRQQDEFFEVEAADSHVKEAISRYFEASGLPPVQIRIWWGKEARRKVTSSCSVKRATVPRGADVSAACQELERLAQLVSANPAYVNQRLAFHKNPEPRNRHAQPGWNFLDSSDFPILAKHCFFVRLELWNGLSRPEIRTSVDVRHAGLDEAQLRSAVEGKLRKAPQYRSGINDKPLWLVVHSDGQPLSTRLPPGLQDEAIALIASVLQAAPASFDKVWWVEDAAYLDVELHEV